MSELFFQALAKSLHGRGPRIVHLGDDSSAEWIDEYTMELTRRSPLNGKYNTMTLPVTWEQWSRWCSNLRPMVQECFPGLTDSQREFIMTGYTDEDWNEMFADDDCREC